MGLGKKITFMKEKIYFHEKKIIIYVRINIYFHVNNSLLTV